MELRLQGLDVANPIHLTVQEDWWHTLTARSLRNMVIERLWQASDSYQMILDAQGELPDPPYAALRQIINGVPTGVFAADEFALWYEDRCLVGDSTPVDALRLPSDALLTLTWTPPDLAERLNPVED